MNERTSKVSHQQFMSGVGVASYWIANWLWDLLCTVLPVALSCLLLVAFDVRGLLDLDNIAGTFVLLALFTSCIGPFTYLISFLFTSPSQSQNTVLILYVIAGTMLLAASAIMGLFDSTKNANKVLIYFYRLFPTYSLAEGICNIMLRKSSIQFHTPPLFSMDVVGWPALYMGVESVLCFLLLLIAQKLQLSPVFAARAQRLWHGLRQRFCCNGSEENHDNNNYCLQQHEDESLLSSVTTDPVAATAGDIVDIDVLNEEMRIRSGLMSSTLNDVIVIDNLTKVYPGAPRPKVAVDSLTFGIGKGECFGKPIYMLYTAIIIFHNILLYEGCVILMDVSCLLQLGSESTVLEVRNAAAYTN